MNFVNDTLTPSRVFVLTTPALPSSPIFSRMFQFSPLTLVSSKFHKMKNLVSKLLLYFTNSFLLTPQLCGSFFFSPNFVIVSFLPQNFIKFYLYPFLALKFRNAIFNHLTFY
ncbi:hypothetical protein HanIR_Chr07g0313781 [Helianthus annuus]|nr:hypothetical protein HanIR_Chr07g0313781 [Helianthus annuus]